MSGTMDSLELQDDQKFALMKFRRSIADIMKPEYDDYYLLRWLRARRWDVEAAEKMLRTSLKTRAMWDFDKWDIPKLLIDYIPTGQIGYDNEGSPVIIFTHYGMDIWGLLHCTTKFQIQKYTNLLIERYIKAGYESSKKHGPQARKLVIVMDVSNLNIKQYAWPPAIDLFITMLKQHEANYPELLKVVYIINVPKLFSVLYNVAKNFLDENTVSKTKLFKIGSDKWKAQLFRHVDPDIFPKSLGGNFVDENGDPDCKSIICYGGKIPKELYTHQSDDNNSSTKNYVETIVGRGKKLQLEFDITKESKERLLTWDFRTTKFNIKFGIYSIDKKTGKREEEIPLDTVSNDMDEIGFINCEPDLTYFVVFDNTSSNFRNKKIRYCVELLANLEDVQELTESIDVRPIAEMILD